LPPLAILRPAPMQPRQAYRAANPCPRFPIRFPRIWRMQSCHSEFHPLLAIGQAHSITQKPTCKVIGRLSETSVPETAPAGAAARQAWFVARRGGGSSRRPCARQTGRERRDREPAGLSETQGPGEARAAGKAPLLMAAARKRGARPNASAIVTRRAETLQGLGEAPDARSPREDGAAAHEAE